MMGFVSLIGSKLGITGALVLALIALGGWHVFSTRLLNARVQAVRAELVSVQRENTTLTRSIQTMQAANAAMIESITRIQASDTASRSALAAKERVALSTARTARLQRDLQKSAGALAAVNRDSACQQLHFGEVGTCVAGSWRSQ